MLSSLDIRTYPLDHGDDKEQDISTSAGSSPQETDLATVFGKDDLL